MKNKWFKRVLSGTLAGAFDRGDDSRFCTGIREWRSWTDGYEPAGRIL